MKLVDILARELKVWPEPKSLLSGSADYCCQSDNTTEVYFGYGRTPIFLSRRAEDTEGVRVTRAEWQAAVDALNAPKVVEWDGVGLPPVGLDVEIKRGNCTWIDGDEWQIGKTATVMASFLNSRDIEMASVQFPGGHCECILARCLSPIRTAEQVAAEEREKAINLMIDDTSILTGTISDRRTMARQLYDAGYRKETKPCGS